MLKRLPGETGVGERNEGICSAHECCLKPQDMFLAHRYYYICPPRSVLPHGAELHIDLLQGWST